MTRFRRQKAIRTRANPKGVRMKEFKIFVNNKPGELARVTEALADGAPATDSPHRYVVSRAKRLNRGRPCIWGFP